MNSGPKMTMLAAGSALIGAMATLALLIANAVPAYPQIAGIAAADANDYVTRTFPFGVPQDGISATRKSIEALPRGIARVEDGRSGFASVSLGQSRDIVGFGSAMNDLDGLADESYVVLGNMSVHSMWTVEMPGRARAVCFDVHNARNFPPTVVIPTYASGSTRDEPRSLVPMTGRGREGRY